MDEELIKLVKENPLLYDFKHKDNRNHVVRKEVWDNIGKQLNKSGESCKETWNKLRNAYTNALSRRRSRLTQKSCRKMPKWTYEDEMSFLPLPITPRTSDQNDKLSIATSGNETQELIQDYNNSKDNDAEMNATKEEDIKPFLLRLANEAYSNDQCDIRDHSFDASTLNYPTFLNEREKSKPQNVKLIKSMDELGMIMKTHSQILQKNLSKYSNNCTCHDEDEIYFLSLAKFVKKLRPAERIRVKGEVSQIIFEAELLNLPNDQIYSHSHRDQDEYGSLSQQGSSEQFVSETNILSTKSEKKLLD